MATSSTLAIDWPATIPAIAAVAAAIIALCALRYSKTSADAAQKSTEAAQQANELMASHLKLTAEAQHRQIRNEIAESQPYIAWRCSGGSIEGQYFGFTNQGAVMANPKVIVDNGFEGWVEPKDVIANGQQANLKIKIPKGQQLPKEVKVSIEFTDKRSERRKIDFNLMSHSVGKFFDFPPVPA